MRVHEEQRNWLVAAEGSPVPPPRPFLVTVCILFASVSPAVGIRIHSRPEHDQPILYE